MKKVKILSKTSFLFFVIYFVFYNTVIASDLIRNFDVQLFSFNNEEVVKVSWDVDTTTLTTSTLIREDKNNEKVYETTTAAKGNVFYIDTATATIIDGVYNYSYRLKAETVRGVTYETSSVFYVADSDVNNVKTSALKGDPLVTIFIFPFHNSIDFNVKVSNVKSLSDCVIEKQAGMNICKECGDVRDNEASFTCSAVGLNEDTNYNFNVSISGEKLYGQYWEYSTNLNAKTLSSVGRDVVSKLSAFANSSSTVYLNWRDNSTSSDPYYFEIQRLKLTPNMPWDITSTVRESSSKNIEAEIIWKSNTTSTPYKGVIERSTSIDFKNDRLFDYNIGRPGKYYNVKRVEKVFGPVSFEGNLYEERRVKDYNLKEMTRYYYRVRECSFIGLSGYYTNSNDSSNPSDVVLMRGKTAKPSEACTWPSQTVLEVFTPPYTPRILSVSTVGSNNSVRVRLKIDPVSESLSGVYYKVFRNGVMIEGEGTYSSSGSNFYYDNNVVSGEHYNYRVQNCFRLENNPQEYCSEMSEEKSITVSNVYNDLFVALNSFDNQKIKKAVSDGINCVFNIENCGIVLSYDKSLKSKIALSSKIAFASGEENVCDNFLGGDCYVGKNNVDNDLKLGTLFTDNSSSDIPRYFNKNLASVFSSVYSSISNVVTKIDDFYRKSVAYFVNKIEGFLYSLFGKGNVYIGNKLTPFTKAQNFSTNPDDYFEYIVSSTTFPYFKDQYLEPDTVYIYRVRVNYGNGTFSNWSKPVAVKTLYGENVQTSEKAPICIGYGICDYTVNKFETANIGSLGRDPVKEHSESQCRVNADCGNVGRVSKTIRER